MIKIGEIVTDDKVIIQIKLTDQEFLTLAKAAHELDVTFNKFVEIILTEYIIKMDAK